MIIFDIGEVTKIIKSSLKAGGEIRKAGLKKTLKATIFPNSRPRIAVFINTIPPNKVQGTGEEDFTKWATENKLTHTTIDLAQNMSMLTPSDMLRLSDLISKQINPLTRAYRISLALRVPNTQAYLIGQQVNREVQLLQYATAGAMKDYALMKNLKRAYQEFPLPYLTKWERFGRLYAFLATIAFLFAIAGIVLV